jgi:hypothetical protein
MVKFSIPLMFLGLTFSEITLTSVPTCLENVTSLEPIKLVWPGLPAGGYEQLLDNEIVSLSFLILPTGATSEITIIDATSKVYLRAAKKTIANTKFTRLNTACTKIMNLKYEQPRTSKLICGSLGPHHLTVISHMIRYISKLAGQLKALLRSNAAH